MGTRNQTSSVDPADALIAKSSVRSKYPMPSDSGLAALRKIIKHNDQCSGAVGRVSAIDARKMLAEHFEWHGGDSALDSVCVRLGRKNYARAS
jgi:hypothetical protein